MPLLIKCHLTGAAVHETEQSTSLCTNGHCTVYSHPTTGTALQRLAVNLVLFPSYQPGHTMFNRVRDGPASEGHWLLDLPLRADLAFDQVILEPKAKVQLVMVLATPRWWTGGGLEEDEGIHKWCFHGKPEQIPPPFFALPPHTVVPPLLVEQVNTPHTAIVGQYWLWDRLLNPQSCKTYTPSVSVAF